MSVSVFSTAELSKIASSLYQNFGDYIDSYKDRQVAKAESLHEYEKRDELSIRLDSFRWVWEKISLANQLESVKTYTKYGDSDTITHNQIDVLVQGMPMTNKELHTQLGLVRYNSSEFLSHEISQKLDGYIEMVSQRIIQECGN